MRRALALAARGRGQTSPNPMVGATVVMVDGTVVGDGFHQRAGTAHAEVRALDRAGERARGSTLVCTLEPCCHQGRTGPCVDRIIRAGIARVVVATEDPNPRVAGGGVRFLEEHGVSVTVGVEADAARRLNAPFFMAMREGRPWVILKAGISLDGQIAEGPGLRTRITGRASHLASQRLRAEVDAVAVGGGTILVDDPRLTVRDLCAVRHPVRVVFDRRLSTPPTARVLTPPGPVIVLSTRQHAAARPEAVEALVRAGARVETTDGSVAAGLSRLADLGVQSVLLEGGSGLNQAVWDAGMIDEVRLFVAPAALGAGGVPLMARGGLSLWELADLRTQVLESDVLVRGYVHRPG
jgi:diaminohydroxyphosphoribosylaminopyrimidine deaminase / 5-amino-6-(5-phosphoribosylamino)uracil reductase